MKDILILDCAEVKCPLALLYVFIELCQAFTDRSYTVKVVNNIKEITNNSIVFMGDDFKINNIGALLNSIAPEAIYIGWYWHNQNTAQLKYFIHTYENMLNPDKRVIFLKEQKKNCPLLLRASENPLFVGTYEKNIQYDFCYMGARYCPHLVPGAPFKGIYYGVNDWKLFLPYNKRKDIYLASIFALGFQADENIANKHVSQRIFEGLAYGCIVLTNSMPACEQTNHIAVYVSSQKELEDQMYFYKANPVLLEEKQKAGYAFIKKYGTNHNAIDLFMKCINI
jgi:hypothetical protein